MNTMKWLGIPILNAHLFNTTKNRILTFESRQWILLTAAPFTILSNRHNI